MNEKIDQIPNDHAWEELDKIKGSSTDLEFANFLIKHIDDPCADQNGNNIRNFYINEAKKQIPKMKNEFAASMLQEKIDQYKFNN
jgi:hypothetical protein